MKSRTIVKVVTLALMVIPLSARGANVIDNGGFEEWDDTQTVDHDGGTYDGDSTGDWTGTWSDFKQYNSVQEPVQWLRTEQRNLEGGSSADLVDPTAGETDAGFQDNDYLPSEGIRGWEVFGNIDVKSSYWETEDSTTGFDTPDDDRISLDLSCTRGGGVQQQFNYNPGDTVTVEFDMSANMYGGRSPRPMLVQVGSGKKSTYTDGDGVFGNFVAADLASYSNVRVFDGTNWQSLSDNTGSAGTRVAYSTVDLTDSEVLTPVSINNGWGTGTITLGSGLEARDADIGANNNVGLEGLAFLFDESGSETGLNSIDNDNVDWTKVAFDIGIDETWFSDLSTDDLTLSFMSLEGDTEQSSNHGPALDDVSVTPEPSSFALLLIGLAGLLYRRKR